MAHTKAPVFKDDFTSGVFNSVWKNPVSIGATASNSVSGGKGRSTRTGSAGAGETLSYLVTTTGPGAAANQNIPAAGWNDGEARCTFTAGSSAAGRNGVHARFQNVGGVLDSYVLREVAHNDPTVWELLWYHRTAAHVETVTSLGTFTPAGVSGYNVTAAISVMGTTIRAKVWAAGTEPAWNSAGNTIRVTDPNCAGSGAWGVTAWNMNTNTEYIEFDDVFFYVANDVVLILGGASGSSTTAPWLCTFSCYANEPLWIAVHTAKGSLADQPSLTSLPAGLTVNATPLADFQWGPTLRRTTIFSAQSNVDLSSQQITASYGGTETGVIIQVVRCSNADNSSSDGSAAFTHVTTTAPGGALTVGVTLPAFTNPVGLSATIFTAGRANGAAALAQTAPEFTLVDTSIASPTSSSTVIGQLGNDLSPSVSWSSGSNQCAGVGAEVMAGDWQTAEYAGAFKGLAVPSPWRRHRRLARSR